MPLTEKIVTGMVTKDDRISGIHPEEYNSKLIRQMAGGGAPTVAFLTKLGSDVIESDTFNLYEEPYAFQRGTVLDSFTKANLTTAYAAGGVTGGIVYLAMSDDDAIQTRRGDILTVIDSVTANEIHVYVRDVVVAGATSSYATVSFMENDTDAVLAATSLTFRIDGVAMGEGSALPEGKMAEPSGRVNWTQTMMEAIELSGRQLVEKERISEPLLKRATRQAWSRLMEKRERTALFGPYKEPGKDPNGKRITYSTGAITAVAKYEPNNVVNFMTSTNADYKGKTWNQAGLALLDNTVETLSRFARGNLMGYTGGLGMLAITKMIRDMGTFEMKPGINEFGIRVNRIIGVNRTIDLHEHQTFTQDPQRSRNLFLFDPYAFRRKVFKGRDLTYIDDKNRDGYTFIDGIKNGWMLDEGLEYSRLCGAAYLKNLGLDNTA